MLRVISEEITAYRRQIDERKNDLPLWEQKVLTCDEAAAYSGIGIRRLRKMALAKGCPFAIAKVLLPHFSCHSLRHTFTTRMCEAGVNVKVIQDTLGHKDISTTLNIYTDVTKELRRSEFEGLDSYFKNEYNKANEVL